MICLLYQLQTPRDWAWATAAAASLFSSSLKFIFIPPFFDHRIHHYVSAHASLQNVCYRPATQQQSDHRYRRPAGHRRRHRLISALPEKPNICFFSRTPAPPLPGTAGDSDAPFLTSSSSIRQTTSFNDLLIEAGILLRQVQVSPFNILNVRQLFGCLTGMHHACTKK